APYVRSKRVSKAQKRIQCSKEDPRLQRGNCNPEPGSVFDVLRAPNVTNWAAIWICYNRHPLEQLS
ncbi:unnamed protein product, partial [Prunus brigantina]